MEAELSKKISEIKDKHKGATGVLLVDKLGLPIESEGNLHTEQSGLMSSIVKNALKLEKLLANKTAEEAAHNDDNDQKEEDSESGVQKVNGANPHGDCTVKAQFTKEELIIRSKNGLTLAIRQNESQ